MNYVRKELQSESADLATAIESLIRTCKWIKDCRDSRFNGLLTSAEQIANDFEIEPVFEVLRMLTRKKHLTTCVMTNVPQVQTIPEFTTKNLQVLRHCLIIFLIRKCIT